MFQYSHCCPHSPGQVFLQKYVCNKYFNVFVCLVGLYFFFIPGRQHVLGQGTEPQCCSTSASAERRFWFQTTPDNMCCDFWTVTNRRVLVSGSRWGELKKLSLFVLCFLYFYYISSSAVERCIHRFFFFFLFQIFFSFQRCRSSMEKVQGNRFGLLEMNNKLRKYQRGVSGWRVRCNLWRAVTYSIHAA